MKSRIFSTDPESYFSYNHVMPPKEMIMKICGKSEESLKILDEISHGLGTGWSDIRTACEFFVRVDRLGLWNNRAALLREALGNPTVPMYALMLYSLYEQFTERKFRQDDIIACKTVDDFKAFVAEHPIDIDQWLDVPNGFADEMKMQ